MTLIIVLAGVLAQTALQYVVDTQIADFLCRFVTRKNLFAAAGVIGVLGSFIGFWSVQNIVGAIPTLLVAMLLVYLGMKSDLSGHKIRYALSTNIFFRVSWNIIWGAWITAFIGAIGFYASFIFLASNGLYEAICRMYLYRRWNKDYKHFLNTRKESEKKAAIRMKIEAAARKQNVVLLEEKIVEVTNKIYSATWKDRVKELNEEEKRKHDQFIEDIYHKYASP